MNETATLQLTTGVDYLIMINNDNPHGTSFYFGEFAQGVLTHYLQGAASVSQDSIDVPANAKVLWHLSPTKVGDYAYYAVNGSSDQKGDKGKISVKLAEGTSAAPQAQVEPTTVTAEAQQTSATSEKETLVINEQRRWLKGGRRD